MNKKLFGFTLAEVLITLAIIGVVAALTLPTLIGNYQKKEVETKLQKIHAVMNQAIKLSEATNGPRGLWNFGLENFLDTYLRPYLNISRIKYEEGNTYDYALIYFQDGGLLVTKSTSLKSLKDPSENNYYGRFQDYYYYPNSKNYTLANLDSRKCVGKTCFPFYFYPREVHNGLFEPYGGYAFLSEDDILNGYYKCAKGDHNPMYCTAWIKQNGWKIPKDYPFQVK